MRLLHLQCLLWRKYNQHWRHWNNCKHEVTIEPENHTNSPAQNRQTSKTRISSIITALRLVYNPQPGVESQVKYANCYTIPTLLPPSWFGGKGADFVLTSSRSPHYSIHCSSQSVNWKGRGAIKNLFKAVTPSIDSSRQKVIAVCSIFSTLQYCIYWSIPIHNRVLFLRYSPQSFDGGADSGCDLSFASNVFLCYAQASGAQAKIIRQTLPQTAEK